ncbi:Uncharacterized conserved protein [Malonomonas rubra DSM 5091]|uniref:Uncharacterized conserved protein n=1 Tax=Malonomonas rubra DSM 5091 TaxID=1122189 RepID=A0A1M6BSL3_MALRU|nr:CRISPR system precrRNA processing endoribonuclease RAMP protein Cas6 [Malonomonas rubra]SHI51732.1 Uncharacterized conserved protein [Malonomonas rubra DSM 5091]
MNYLPPLPEQLQQVEYSKLYFYLQFQEYFDLPQWGLLQLRREFQQALKALESWGRCSETDQIKNLLQPQISNDPLIRRQAQKPSPAFVLLPDPQSKGLFQPQQSLKLPVFFLGQGIQGINAFIILLQQVGQQGLHNGNGRFVLDAVESEDGSGVRSMEWSGGQSEFFSAPVNNLSWLLEQQTNFAETVSLEVISPLRLLKQKKPLFKASIGELFPFIVRRVSSLLACHAGVEICDDPKRYIQLAQQIEEIENALQWRDWRRLKNDHQAQDVGGLMGSLLLSGEHLSELFWYLQMGSLFNVGKGAAYGAGQFTLKTNC